jgi:hypothetical protein
MPDLWENPFGYALLKIERANKHISDIQERLSTSVDAYPPTLKIDSKTGEQYLYYVLSDRTIRSDIALMAGDAVHNLWCAFDYGWSGILKSFSPQAIGRYNKMPFGNDRRHLETTLTKTAEIDPASNVFRFLMDTLKPYRGGDWDVCALHDLDIDDKHKLLTPILQVVAINGVELQDEQGRVDIRSLGAVKRFVGYRIPVPSGTHVKNNGKASLQVVFQNGTPTEGLEIVPTLRYLASKTQRLIRALQRMSLDDGRHPKIGALGDG